MNRNLRPECQRASETPLRIALAHYVVRFRDLQHPYRPPEVLWLGISGRRIRRITPHIVSAVLTGPTSRVQARKVGRLPRRHARRGRCAADGISGDDRGQDPGGVRTVSSTPVRATGRSGLWAERQAESVRQGPRLCRQKRFDHASKSLDQTSRASSVQTEPFERMKMVEQHPAAACGG